MRPLPKRIYVARAGEDTRDEFLNAAEHAQDVIEGNGPTVIGTYELVETRKLGKAVVQVGKPTRSTRR